MKFLHPKKWLRQGKEKITNFILYYFLPDKFYYKIRYYKVTGKKLNLKNPQNINEKMQWIKLYDRKPEYTIITDKLAAKKYAANIVGEEYIIPLLGVWNTFEEIDFDTLPNQFVLKCTHDSGSVIICTDKSQLDLNFVKNKLTQALKHNYYRYQNLQWAYKNIKPKIIAEQYLSSKLNNKIEYQIFCNNGIPLFFLVRNDLGYTKNEETKYAISYTLSWERVAYRIGEEKLMHIQLPKPVNYEKMIEFARLLSKNTLHLRVDYYEIDEKLYLGELTLYSNGGFFSNYNQEALDLLNRTLTLPI